MNAKQTNLVYAIEWRFSSKDPWRLLSNFGDDTQHPVRRIPAFPILNKKLAERVCRSLETNTDFYTTKDGVDITPRFRVVTLARTHTSQPIGARPRDQALEEGHKNYLEDCAFFRKHS